MRDEKHLDNDTQTKYVGLLKQLLLWANNPVLERMHQKKQLPKKVSKEVKTLSENEIWRVIDATKRIEGWRGIVATFLSVMYPFTGLRPSELRQAQIVDLDTTTWALFVAHPKGDGKYGVKRTVPILPPARPYLIEYLKQRSENLSKYGISENQCEQLIPRFVRGRNETAYFSLTALHVLKYEIEAIAGIPFKLKTFRATYGQMLKDRGANIEHISKLMGHHTTTTTETYYARVKDRAAFDGVNQVWEDQALKVNSPLDKNKNAPPIYQ
jgi:integrase